MTPLRRGESGFSLIEVVITIAIMMTLTMAVAAMLRGGFEVRDGLSQRAKVVHRMQVAVDRIARDIEHAFLISTVKDQNRNPLQRRTGTIFRLEKSGGTEKLSLTTKTHRAMVKGSHESDLTYVVYELRDSQTSPGRKDLYRGNAKVIPLAEDRFRENPPMALIARQVKSLTFEAWDGEKWSRDAWDSTRGDTRNRLPKMMKVTLEMYRRDRVDGDGQDQSVDEEIESVGTVVYIADAIGHAEIKQPSKSIRWEGF